VTAEQRRVLKVAIDAATRARVKEEDRRAKSLYMSYLHEHGLIGKGRKLNLTDEQRRQRSERAKAARRAGNGKFGKVATA
jgi:hypothetical protein